MRASRDISGVVDGGLRWRGCLMDVCRCSQWDSEGIDYINAS